MTFKSIDALKEMGIPCTRNTADQWIRVLKKDGKLPTSRKFGRLWVITLEDVNFVKKEMDNGYKPFCRHVK